MFLSYVELGHITIWYYFYVYILVFYFTGFSVNDTVHGIDSSDDYDYEPPKVTLMDNYTMIKLEVHPAVYDYVTIREEGKISKTEKIIV